MKWLLLTSVVLFIVPEALGNDRSICVPGVNSPNGDLPNMPLPGRSEDPHAACAADCLAHADCVLFSFHEPNCDQKFVNGHCHDVHACEGAKVPLAAAGSRRTRLKKLLSLVSVAVRVTYERRLTTTHLFDPHHQTHQTCCTLWLMTWYSRRHYHSSRRGRGPSCKHTGKGTPLTLILPNWRHAPSSSATRTVKSACQLHCLHLS